MNCQTNKENPN